MPLDVAIYAIAGHRRSTTTCHAMFSGIKAAGDRPRLFMETDYRAPMHDAAVFYGYTATLRQVMADYIAVGRQAVYIDLGYWGREGQHGHHKVAVNSRHPTDYFQRRRHDDRRAHALGLNVADWKAGGAHILLAGMGAKAAEAEGFQPEAWEREAISRIRGYSNRPIVYRPKPSWTQAKPISGTTFSWGGPEPRGVYRTQRLHEVLAGCHAVVTHHSNVAVEGIVAGIPAFCWKGVALPMSSQDFSQIEYPLHPEGRQQWLNDICYTQWNVAEMHQGLPWRHLKDEGLIG
jgi:hypothetical protein